MKFYQLSAADTIRELGTNGEKGLSAHEVLSRQKKYGPNKLKKKRNRTVLQIIWGQLSSLLVIMLICAGLFSWYLGEYRDMTIIFAIVVINASIGFFQEFKSEKILESLQGLIHDTATVIRDGKQVEILAQDLVPGDIVLMQEGDGIPADIRLIQSDNFATNDFILTGESLPQKKDHALIFSRDVSVTDQDNCVFMGISVARGFATGVVIATGMKTEIGKIAETSQKMKEGASPLQAEIGNLAKTLTKITIGIALGLFCLKWFSTQEPIKDSLIFAVAIASAMVPEGLPAQITIALSLGVGRLAKKKAIVKKLSSIETLGSATVIAADKTGTITKNEMTITHCHFDGQLFTISGSGYKPDGKIFDSNGNIYNKDNLLDLKVFFLDGYLASTGRVNPPDKEHKTWYPLGDPTEAAFATLASKTGVCLDETDKLYPKLRILAFDSDRKRMTIIRKHKGKTIAFMKGAIESVLSCSTRIIEKGIVRDLSNEEKEKYIAMVKVYASQAYRVLAVAYKDLPHENGISIEQTEKDFIFAGFVAMLDPPHNEVAYAVQRAFDAHMKVVMITGDDAVTAKAVAKRIGLTLPDGNLPEVINKDQLSTLSDDMLSAKLRARSVIFSRVSPDDKNRIVTLLKKDGEIVAVTGDGVNDTLSLKTAHIGVSMGAKGSEVAKEASDMILLDDNFSTIVVAIQEGRTIYKNLEKTILGGLSGNAGELTAVLLGFVGGYFHLPMSIFAIQILAVDLIGEVLPLTFLTYDPPESELMTEPPRDQTRHVLNRKSLAYIAFFGSLIGLMAFGSFLITFLTGEGSYLYERATTATYLGIVFGQFVNIISLRTNKTALNRYFFSNIKLLFSFLLTVILLLLIVYHPVMNQYLHTSPLSLKEWTFPVIGALLVLFVHEVRKALFVKKTP